MPDQFETRTPEQHFEQLVTELNIPRQLAVAIKEQESGRRPFQTPDGGVLTSNQNARGWFQVLPETAAGYKLDANDPFQNIEAGLRYIKEGLDKNHNDPDIAARYYHGGPDRRQWGPVTEQYGTSVGKRMRALLAADGGQATADPGTAPAARTHRPGDIVVPTAEELRQQTGMGQTPTDPAAPPAPSWTSPERLRTMQRDIGIGALKSVGQLATNAVRYNPALQIPQVRAGVDRLFGGPGSLDRAFETADQATATTPGTSEGAGKVVGDIGTGIVMGGPATRLGLGLAGRVAPRLAPVVGRTVANILPRVAVEAPASAGIAALQGQDPETAAKIAAGIPAAGAVARLPFTGALNPVAQRAVDWGRAQGIPVDLLASTSNRFAKGLQVLAEHTPLGGVVRAGFDRVRANAMTKAGQRILDDVHGAPTSGLEAGASTTTALDQRVAQVGARASKHYKTVEAIHADPVHTQRVPTGKLNPTTGKPRMTRMPVPVALDQIRQTLRPMLRRLERAPAATRDASPAYPVLRELVRGNKPYRSLLELEDDLSAIKALADTKGGLGNKGQGLAKQAVKAVQQAIDDAARAADPKMLDALQKARKATALKHNVDKLRQLFAGTAKTRATRGEQSQRAFQQATAGHDVNFEYMAKLAKQVPPAEMRKLGRGYLQDLLQTATKEGGYERAARIANEWETLGDQTKRLFYSQKHIDDLDNFFRLGRRLAERPNPSGTALTATTGGSATWIYTDPERGIPYTLGAGAAAFLMNHPTGVRLLTEGLTIPGGNAAAGVWAQRLRQFLKDHGEDNEGPPPAPPK